MTPRNRAPCSLGVHITYVWLLSTVVAGNRSVMTITENIQNIQLLLAKKKLLIANFNDLTGTLKPQTSLLYSDTVIVILAVDG